MKTTFSPASRRTIQAIGLIGLGLGLGTGGTFPFDQLRNVLLLALFGCTIGGYLLFVSIETPARNLKAQGIGLMGAGLGLGMGGTFPDGTEWVTWLLCAFWCVVGTAMLLSRPAAEKT
jgi:hypothetical protein